MKINKYESCAGFRGKLNRQYIGGNYTQLETKMAQLHPNTKLSIQRKRAQDGSFSSSTTTFNWAQFKDSIIISNDKINSRIVLSPNTRFPQNIYLQETLRDCFAYDNPNEEILQRLTDNPQLLTKDIDRILFNNVRDNERISQKSFLGKVLPNWVREHLNTRYQKKINNLAEQFGVVLGDGQTDQMVSKNI